MQDSDNTEIKIESVSKSRKIFRWLEMVCFLITFIMVLVVLSRLFDPIKMKAPGAVVSRDKSIVASLSEDPDTMDVLVVGDSEAMVMVSPEIFMNEEGISSYNCNQLGQRISETYFFMKKILEKQHPKVIILETNVITHEVSIKNEPQLTFNAITQDQLPFLRFHSAWRCLFGWEPPEKYDGYCGYEAIAVVEPYSGEDYMFETDERAWLDPITIYYMDKILELCKNKNAELLLVSSPSAINMDYPRHNAVQDYADKNGLTFIDFNLMTDEIGIDWSKDTGDNGDHINKYGNAKTSGYLMKYLKENYDLPDHRKDK